MSHHAPLWRSEGPRASCLESKQWYGTAHCHGKCLNVKKLWSGSEYTSNNLAQQRCLSPNGIKAVGILAPRSGLLLCSILSLGSFTHSPEASTEKLKGSWEIHASQLILSGSTAAIKTSHNKISVDSSGKRCGFYWKHLQWLTSATWLL